MELKDIVNDAIMYTQYTNTTQYIVEIPEINYIGRVSVLRDGMLLLAIIKNKYKLKDRWYNRIYNRLLSKKYYAITRNSQARLQMLRGLERLKAARSDYKAKRNQRDSRKAKGHLL